MNEETAKRLSHVKAGIDKVDASAESLASSPCSRGSDTPETDRNSYASSTNLHGRESDVVPADFARNLERRRDQYRDAHLRLVQSLNDLSEELLVLRSENAQLRIERDDAILSRGAGDYLLEEAIEARDEARRLCEAQRRGLFTARHFRAHSFPWEDKSANDEGKPAS